MSTSDRLAQIQRAWRTDLKYRIPADTHGRELHETVADLLDEIEHLGDGEECDCDLDYDNDRAATEQEHADDIRQLEEAHADRLGEFAPALEELHQQAHGTTSLYMCPAEPCRGLYRLLPNARGSVLTR